MEFSFSWLFKIHNLLEILVTSQFWTHTCVDINSKGNVSLQIGLQKYCASNINPSNSLIFSLCLELAGHSS